MEGDNKMLLEDRLNAHINVEKERIDEVIKQRNELLYKLTHDVAFPVPEAIFVFFGLKSFDFCV